MNVKNGEDLNLETVELSDDGELSSSGGDDIWAQATHRLYTDTPQEEDRAAPSGRAALLHQIPRAVEHLTRVRSAAWSLRDNAEELMALMLTYKAELNHGEADVDEGTRLAQIARTWRHLQALYAGKLADAEKDAETLRLPWSERVSGPMAMKLGERPYLTRDEIAQVLDSAGLYQAEMNGLVETPRSVDPDDLISGQVREVITRAVAGPEFDESAEAASDTRAALEQDLEPEALAAVDRHLDQVQLHSNLREDATAQSFFQLGYVEGIVRVMYPGLRLRDVLLDSEKLSRVIEVSGIRTSLADLALRILLSDRAMSFGG